MSGRAGRYVGRVGRYVRSSGRKSALQRAREHRRWGRIAFWRADQRWPSRVPIAAPAGTPAGAAEYRGRPERHRQVEPVPGDPAARRRPRATKRWQPSREKAVCPPRSGPPEVIRKAVRERVHPVQGTVRSNPVSLRLGFTTGRFGYAIDLGLPQPSKSAFFLDPEIKCESIWNGELLLPAAVLTERRRGLLRSRSVDGSSYEVPYPIAPFDSMLSVYTDVERAPELTELRQQIRSWRFYDSFRTDPGAPGRAGIHRYAYAGPGPRRVRSGRGVADHPRDG
jgi:hypothetical protein